MKNYNIKLKRLEDKIKPKDIKIEVEIVDSFDMEKIKRLRAEGVKVILVDDIEAEEEA